MLIGYFEKWGTSGRKGLQEIRGAKVGKNDDNYQKCAVRRKSNRCFLWSWVTEARMKKKQSKDPRREEAEEK